MRPPAAYVSARVTTGATCFAPYMNRMIGPKTGEVAIPAGRPEGRGSVAPFASPWCPCDSRPRPGDGLPHHLGPIMARSPGSMRNSAAPEGVAWQRARFGEMLGAHFHSQGGHRRDSHCCRPGTSDHLARQRTHSTPCVR